MSVEISNNYSGYYNNTVYHSREIEQTEKAKIEKGLKFVFTELSNFIDWFSEGEEINEHYQGELYLLLEKY